MSDYTINSTTLAGLVAVAKAATAYRNAEDKNEGADGEQDDLFGALDGLDMDIVDKAQGVHKRVVYVLSGGDVAVAYDDLVTPNRKVSTGSELAFYDLPSEQQEALVNASEHGFDLADSMNEIGIDYVTNALMDAVEAPDA